MGQYKETEGSTLIRGRDNDEMLMEGIASTTIHKTHGTKVVGSRPTDIINTYSLHEAGYDACIIEHHSLMIHSRRGYGQGSKHFNFKTSTNTFGGSRIIDLGLCRLLDIPRCTYCTYEYKSPRISISSCRKTRKWY